MVKHIGEHSNKSFAELVEVLSKRYRPDVLEARGAYDSKPATSFVEGARERNSSVSSLYYARLYV
ncbi:hypothetical protein CFP56_023117 [Quercus suber]|uniref:Uncharacterized protein n=1 Tax=Quercus suber TaxID=58331 RepID=A0AAW0LZ45_QUESU